ncbi:MAG: FtsX-like permease family protein [Erysipelotrichaceae bacterium]|nr:FtsX-like permease family protein [Erysipelotrichaceae bacterium]
MFRLDTFRLIRKTSKRFLSLCLIVFIGVAFMMGLMSCKSVMIESVDDYNDMYNLQDLQLYSQYGFCNADVYRLMKTEGVKDVFASRMVDVYLTKYGSDSDVARVQEVDRNINKLELISGRMPSAKDECVVLSNGSYKVGDIVHFDLDNIDDYLDYKTYKVVGVVKSPECMTKILGTSNLNNKDIDVYVYIPNENFVLEYYTTILLTFDGCKEAISYSDEYKAQVKSIKKNVETTAFYYQDFLKTSIQEKYQKELDDGYAEFNKQKEEGQKQLDDAKQQLDDANIQIVTYEAQLQTLEATIDQLQSAIDGNSDDFNTLYNDAKEYAASTGVKINSSVKKMVQDYLQQTLDQTQEQYDSLKGQLAWAKRQYQQGIIDYSEALMTFNDEIEKAQNELRKAQQDLDELPKGQWILLDRDSHYSSYMYENNAKQMGAIGYSLPVLFYLVAALVCLTTMTRLIDEQRGQIGIFVALGYTNFQIICKYMVYAFLASITGGVLGLGAGMLIFPTVVYETWKLMYELPDMKVMFPLNLAAICLCAFVFLMMGVTAYVVHNTLKEIPAAIMRPKAPKSAKAILLEKIPFIWNSLGFTSKITARNIFRYKSRFLMTVIGIAGCTGLLVVGFGVKDSISEIVNIQYGNIFNYDYQLKFENDHHMDENITVLEENFDNDLIFKFTTYTSKVYLSDTDDTINAIVIDPRDANYAFRLRATDKKTPLLLENDGVIISEKFSINNNIKAGDKIIIESANGIKAEVTVTAVCEMYFQHYMYISNAYYQKVFDENVNYDYLGVSNSNGDTLMDQLDSLQDFTAINDFNSFIAQFNIMIQALNLIIAVIIVTAGSLSFVVLVNLTQVNISERVREIATLKVLGFRDKEVNSYIFKEIFILTILGAVIGLPLGLVEHHVIMNIINMDMMMFGMNITVYSYVYSFAITIIFALIVFQFMKKPLKQIDMIESLKSVE